MNSPHLLLYALIALMLLSSVVCILFVTIQNRKAVANYYKANQITDTPSEKLKRSPKSITPVIPAYKSQGYSIAS